MTVSTYVTVYLLAVNLTAFAAFGTDKWKAVHHRYRIPERVLLGIAVIGGSVGAMAGMYCFRHKTRHLKFKAGIPVILALQISLAIAAQIW